MKHMISAIVLLASSFTTGFAHARESRETAKEWNVRENIPVADFAIQLHRGAGIYKPENTLEAFEYAWSLGAIPEADLSTTRDGIIVAFHDKNFKRVVKGASPELQELGVADLSFEELAKIEVGSWRGEEFAGQRIPRMTDVFEAMRGRPERELYIDIKDVDLEQLVQEVKAANVNRQVIFTSTHYDLIREWKTLLPESQTLNWIGGGESRIEERLEILRASHFEGITQLQLHVRLNADKSGPEPYNLSKAFIRNTGIELREHGITFQALPWKLADRDIFWSLLDLGVASFATDYPEETVQAVRDYYKRDR